MPMPPPPADTPPSETLWAKTVHVLPYLVMALSFLMTFFFWRQYDHSLNVRSQVVFKDRADEIMAKFFTRMTDDEQILRGAAGLFNASENVTRDEWRRYALSLSLDKHFPGFQGLGFTEVVHPKDLERHIQRVRGEGFPDYRLWPEGKRREYTAIIYLEPFDWRNQRAFGYDMFSDPLRREAMSKARDLGEAVTTGPVTLVQETKADKQTGVLMYIPVYQRGLPLETVEERRSAVQGYAFSPIRIKNFLSATFPKMPNDIGFRIYIDKEPTPARLLYDSVADSNMELPESYRGELQTTRSFQRFGQNWLLTFQSLPQFAQEQRKSQSRGYLIVGITVSILLSVIAFMLRSAHAGAIAAAQALKESRELYRRISEDSPAYIATFLPDGALTYVNPALANDLRQPQEELVGRSFFEFILPEYQGPVRQGLNTLSPQHPTQTMEQALKGPNDAVIWHEWTHRAVFDEHGGIAEFQAVGQNITERKKAAEERARLEQQMLHTQKMESLGVLAGGVAHDFNNILMAIIGNVDLSLMKIEEASPITANLRNIEKAAMRAADLAKQMLAYSGKGRFVIEKVDLNRLIEKLHPILEPSLPDNAVLTLKLHKPLPVVEADANQMRQILMNLFMNSVEALGENGGEITIRTDDRELDRESLKDLLLGEDMAEGRYVVLEVADTGCGMEKEVLDKVFDPFFTTKFTGRGLGLAAALGIARGHKGGIRITSEPGKGSVFQVLLPTSEAPPQEASVPERIEDGWSGAGNILLVDDEEVVRTIGSELLKELGFTTVLAESGAEAIEIFKGNRDLRAVILDLTMPGMDGEECFRELRRIDPEAKVIVSSGFSEQDVVQKFPGKELAGYIQKPYTLKALKEVMRKV
ncbi:Multi-sensor hybrid histidine kinase [Citrifermentans bremense]|uniref:histidine kinase n=1 Tax=Citrifermentans bremense TaxID=60035 RepID=A0A6S6M3E6_9BACT|nr:CHASE domain-containing protein [Citrifermentans bremense]BCG46476.1 Multi-sensor hybrid histidine kinase [Citrifermentans bremense]